MKRDIRSMRAQQEQAAPNAASQGFDNETLEGIECAINKYSTKSGEELLGELGELKSSGVIDDSALNDFVSKLAPMLNAEQQSRLYQVVQSLK